MVQAEDVKKAPKQQYTEKLHKQLCRKAKKEKWSIIQYRSHNGVRNGWIVHDTGKVMQVRLIGDCRNTRIPQKEREYIEQVK